ncbi:MAG: type 1 glutamine amidotransferase domain-containing protein [Spirochaetia bacterium]|nr:type 1 glutamine amidotransferase domain-containing protein [Spirochaetia bacterium]
MLATDCAKKQVIGEPAIASSPALAAAGGKKVLIVISAHPRFGDREEKTGYWLSEVTHFYHVMAQNGFKIDIASPEGRPGVMDPSSNDMNDSLNRTFWDNQNLRQQLEGPLDPAKINARDYAVIYYAGGHGTMWDFPTSDSLARLAASIYEQGGIVSAVCHGPAGLLNIKLSNGEYLIKGKKVTGFANFEEKLVGKTTWVPYLLEDSLKEKGGSYSKAFFPFVGYAVTDDRLVTGQNPGSATGVAEHVIAVLAQTTK